MIELGHLRKNKSAQIMSPHGSAMEVAKMRLVVVMVAFILCFFVIAGRLGHLMIVMHGDQQTVESMVESKRRVGRADIVDRNGVVLATSLVTQSLYANPRVVVNAEEAAKKLSEIFSELNYAALLTKLKADRGFVWLKRNLTPRQQNLVYGLGLPGIGFQREEKRIYPQAHLLAHVLGCTDVDSRGVSGIEKSFNEALTQDHEPLQLSLDVRVQHVLRDEILRKIDEFNALGGCGIVMDVSTGELIALASFPDYDPHQINGLKKERLFNAATSGVFEIGSSMKILTTALALDSGVVKIDNRYDISEPIRVGRFRIKDYHPKKIVADVPQIFLYSSNIGMVKMVSDLGVERHREYLGRFGLFEAPILELPEIGSPLVPVKWRDINSMTISYGYGLAISPLQIANAVSSVVNGGILRRPRLLKLAENEEVTGVRVISEKTSQTMRDLMRLVVQHGTGRNANAHGYDVGGKTGTAEKLSNGRYRRENMVSFISAFPMSSPRYMVLVMVDEPKGNKASHGFATAGWIAAPAVKNVVSRIAPMLGVQPTPTEQATSPQYEVFKASAQVPR